MHRGRRRRRLGPDGAEGARSERAPVRSAEEFGLYPKATREPLQGFNERRNKYHKWASETTKPQMRTVDLRRKNHPRD